RDRTKSAPDWRSPPSSEIRLPSPSKKALPPCRERHPNVLEPFELVHETPGRFAAADAHGEAGGRADARGAGCLLRALGRPHPRGLPGPAEPAVPPRVRAGTVFAHRVDSPDQHD